MSGLLCQKRPSNLAKTQLALGAIKKPEWLKIRHKTPNSRYKKIKALAGALNLSTVCQEAMCPNIAECWGNGTATFMIMGDTCTRACRFCNVNHGKPKPLNPEEPKGLAEAVIKLGLNYAVVTSVDRDDMPDGGASHFAQCVRHLRRQHPMLIIEVLTPDFQGKQSAIKKIIDAEPHVYGHNIETVKRLQRCVRDFRAGYEQSLFVLEFVKKNAPAIYTKSSIMAGVGEKPEEIIETMKDLRKVEVDFLTIGQYLRPAAWNIPVAEYVTPEQFEKYREKGLELGFKYVAAGPYVRSSYKAYDNYRKLQSID